MCKPAAALICLLALLFAWSPTLAAEKRVALVIGNSAYRHTRELPNARSDSADIAASFRTLGFEVIEGRDLVKVEMEAKIKAFAGALADSELAVFFYAGHGIQVSGVNYMVPVDAELTAPAAIDFELVRLDLVQRTMEWGPKTNILFLDACRNNPLARNLARSMGTRSTDIGQGLAPAEAGVGTLISFSTQPGNVALDGEGRNSPFAGALVKRLTTTEDDLSGILIGVRNDVMRQTGNKQIPWEHSALTGRVFFKTAPVPAQPLPTPPAANAAPPASLPEQAVTTSPPKTAAPREVDPRLELALWNAVRDSRNVDMLQAYLAQYPNGAFARLAAIRIEEAQKQAALQPAPKPVPDATREKQAEVEKRLQEALRRAGCLDGEANAVWGEKSEAALRKFAAARSERLASFGPTEANLNTVAASSGRVCPLECGRGMLERDGECVAQPQEAKPRPAVKAREREKARTREREPVVRRAAPPVSRAERRQPQERFQICMDARNQMIDCNEGGVVLRR